MFAMLLSCYYQIGRIKVKLTATNCITIIALSLIATVCDNSHVHPHRLCSSVFDCFIILVESNCVLIVTCLSMFLRCYSYIGKVNLFPQLVNLRSSCFDEVSPVSVNLRRWIHNIMAQLEC